LKTLSFHSSTLTFDAPDYDRDGDADNGMQDSSSDDFDFAAQVSFTYLFLFIFLDMTKHAVASRQTQLCKYSMHI
jgi:hypothetical protein